VPVGGLYIYDHIEAAIERSWPTYFLSRLGIANDLSLEIGIDEVPKEPVDLVRLVLWAVIFYV